MGIGTVDQAMSSIAPSRDDIRRAVEHLRWYAKAMKSYRFVADHRRQAAFDGIQPAYQQIMAFAQSPAQQAPETLWHEIQRAQYRLQLEVLYGKLMQHLIDRARRKAPYTVRDRVPQLGSNLLSWLRAYDAGDAANSQWLDAFRIDVELESAMQNDEEHVPVRRTAKVIPLPQV